MHRKNKNTSGQTLLEDDHHKNATYEKEKEKVVYKSKKDDKEEGQVVK